MNTKFLLKFGGQEYEVMRVKQSQDGSGYLIPLPPANKRGLHFSSHSSGIFNIRAEGIDCYDVDTTMLMVSKEIETNIMSFVRPMVNIDYVLIFKAPEENRYIQETQDKTILDIDSLLEYLLGDMLTNCKSYKVLTDNNIGLFLLKYARRKHFIACVSKNKEVIIPSENNPFYGLVVDNAILNIAHSLPLFNVFSECFS